MSMTAIEAREFGGPEVLTPASLPAPVPGPGEAVIAVSVADVLFLDTMIRSGLARDTFPQRPPYVPGNGIAGHVAAVGDGIDPAWAGRRVVARTGPHGGSGGYSERALVPASRLVAVPEEVDLRVAAALLHDGSTALGLLAGTPVQRGDTVLVVGAAGGMALLLAQLARAAGARVIGAARLADAPRRAEKLDAIRRAGAEAVVDYGSPDWTRRVVEASAGDGPDVVFDGVGGSLGQAAFGIVARGGRFSAHGAPGGGFAPVSAREAERRGVTVRGIEQVQYPSGRPEELIRDALAEAAAGRLRPVIGQVFPLERAADAHAALAARSTIGKTLLRSRALIAASAGCA
ncbi:MAG TPA: zinc-binding dehydrogenase [Trebonia sp.]|jgi:NADPH2:quinone reductase|nr:zinc-binding dehydrogenase [Trebonia sp.]